MDGGRLLEERLEPFRVGVGDRAGVERAEPRPQLLGAGERRLHRHLLIEQHADQQGERIVGEQSVGGVVTGDVQRGHASMVAPVAGCGEMHSGNS